MNVEAEFEDNKSEVLAIAFSPDGSLIAAGDVSVDVLYPFLSSLMHDRPRAVSSSSMLRPSL